MIAWRFAPHNHADQADIGRQSLRLFRPCGLSAAPLAVLGNRMTNRLFVYGTLAPGRPNEHILADVSGTWEPATVRGSLLQEGWGAVVGYPGIVLTESGDQIEGFVFTSEELAAHWARLDKFEGDGYVRVLVSAQLQDGATVEAYIYALASALATPSGGS